jgi:hypothetical protein
VILLFTLTDAEHGSPSGWADTFCSWFAIFHGGSLGAFHFFLRATFHANVLPFNYLDYPIDVLHLSLLLYFDF